VRKPSWFAYKYLNALKGKEIPSADSQVWAAVDGASVAAVVWDFQLPDQKGRSNGTFFSKLVPNALSAPVSLKLAGLKPGRYRLKIQRTGYKTNDAYSAYIEMGAPKALTAAQLQALQDLTRDRPEAERAVTVGRTGEATVAIPMHSNDIVLVTLVPAG